jgi:GR25 family glycosyltransferase involved in LPS biosynthesis
MKHIEAYRRIIEAGVSVALIVEDDTQLVPDFKLRLRDYLAQIPEGWDMLCVGEGNPAVHVQDQIQDKQLYRMTWDQKHGSEVLVSTSAPPHIHRLHT